MKEKDSTKKEVYDLVGSFFVGTVSLLVSAIFYFLYTSVKSNIYLVFSALTFFLFILFYYLTLLFISAHYIFRTYQSFIANRKLYYQRGLYVLGIAVVFGLWYFSGVKGVILFASTIFAGVIIAVVGPKVKKWFDKKKT